MLRSLIAALPRLTEWELAEVLYYNGNGSQLGIWVTVGYMGMLA